MILNNFFWTEIAIQNDYTDLPKFVGSIDRYLLLSVLPVVAAASKGFLIARFIGPTWGPSGSDKTQVDPMLALWTLLSGMGSTRNLRNWWLLTFGHIFADLLSQPVSQSLIQSDLSVGTRKQPLNIQLPVPVHVSNPNNHAKTHQICQPHLFLFLRDKERLEATRNVTIFNSITLVEHEARRWLYLQNQRYFSHC